MTKNPRSKLLLHACPRCHGDLFPDSDDNDFACLQCGRRITQAQLTAALQTSAAEERVLVPAA